MKSFGIWYKPIDDESEKPIIGLHVNFWSLEFMKTKDRVSVPYLDIGICVENFKTVKTLIFHCPFVLLDVENTVIDLSEKMIKQENAVNIFNKECEIITTDIGCPMIRLSSAGEDKTDYIVFPFNQSKLGNTNAVSYSDYDEKPEDKQTNLNINFSFEDFIKSIEKSNNNDLKAAKKVYLRFRIKSDLLGNLYFDSEPLNKSFESAFAASRIIDFQVNKKRSISIEIRHQLNKDNVEWPTFKAVDFLLMEPSSHTVEALSSKQGFSCRNLETDIWNDYLDNAISYDYDDMLAYHLKIREEVSDYASLIRINYSKAKINTIITYCICVIALGMVGSAVSTIIFELAKGIGNSHFKGNVICPFMIGSILLATLLIAFSIWLSRREK